MKKIRVAHLIYSEKVGGSEMVAGNICSYLGQLGFDPLVLFMLRSKGGMPKILQNLSVACKHLNMFWRTIPFESYYIAYMLNKMRVDIIHIHHIPLYLRVAKAVELSRVKGVVFTEHAKFSIQRSKSLQQGCREAAQQADYFTTISSDLKNYFVHAFNIPDSRIQVILNGVDVIRFNPEKKNSMLRSMLPDDFTGKILIHVGRLAEAKDHKTLLGTMRLLRKHGHGVALFLVGDGELRPAIEQQIADLDLKQHVRMLGMRTDVDRLLLGADMFVMSSQREGLPMVLMEAMSCGLPVVSTDVGGIAEIIRNHETGLLIEPKRSDLLAQAIENILNSSDDGESLGRRARKVIIEKYSLAAVAESYARLYERIVSG